MLICWVGKPSSANGLEPGRVDSRAMAAMIPKGNKAKKAIANSVNVTHGISTNTVMAATEFSPRDTKASRTTMNKIALMVVKRNRLRNVNLSPMLHSPLVGIPIASIAHNAEEYPGLLCLAQYNVFSATRILISVPATARAVNIGVPKSSWLPKFENRIELQFCYWLNAQTRALSEQLHPFQFRQLFQLSKGQGH